MKHIFLAGLICLMNTTLLQAQLSKSPANPENGLIRCITTELDEMRRAAHPEMGTVEDFEYWLQEKMAYQPKNVSRNIITIPIIVHVIHDGEAIGEGFNIPYEQVASQIEVLNEDFRRMEGTAGYNTDSVGADTQIEFCMATLDASGRLLTNVGIDRVDRNDMGWTQPPYSSGYINQFIKPATIWDPTKYFNVWVTGLSGNILGFAQSPIQSTLPDLTGNSSATTDGVVSNYRNFGRVGNLIAPYNKGRTMTHEVGHWLGLHHVWGPSNSSTNCTIDDFCDDTPMSDEPNYGCQTGSTSCESVNQVENYMEYSDDACMNIFTRCQKERMQTVLLNSPRRKELLTAESCLIPTIAPTADFAYTDTVTCDGRIQFFDESLNLATDWFWLFDNGETSTEKNPFTRFDSTALYNITLIASNPIGVSQTVKSLFVVVQAPPISAGEDIIDCLGAEVQLSANLNDTTASYLWFPTVGISDPFSPNPTLTVGSTSNYILNVSFESGCVVKDTIKVIGSPSPTTLALPIGSVTIAFGNSIQLNAIGANSYVWSPAVGLSDPNIPTPVASPDTTTLYTVVGSNGSGCEKADSVLVIVTRDVSIEPFLAAEQVYIPFPNPANQNITFGADFRESGLLNLSLYDLNGRRLHQMYEERVGQGDWRYKWEREANTPAGTYLVRWEMNGARFIQKVVLF